MLSALTHLSLNTSVSWCYFFILHEENEMLLVSFYT